MGTRRINTVRRRASMKIGTRIDFEEDVRWIVSSRGVCSPSKKKKKKVLEKKKKNERTLMEFQCFIFRLRFLVRSSSRCYLMPRVRLHSAPIVVERSLVTSAAGGRTEPSATTRDRLPPVRV